MNYCIDCRADIPDTEENEGVYLCATCAREHDTPAEGYDRALDPEPAPVTERTGARRAAK